MRRLVPLAFAAAALAGCARLEVPDGPTLLGRSHGAEQTLCYDAVEVNEQVHTGAWPRKGAPPGSTEMVMYGRPVVTLVRRTQVGPQQKQSEILASNEPGGLSAGMVVAQNGPDGWRFIPAARRLDILTFPASDVGPLNWLALVLYNYDVVDVRKDRVAGVPAWHLRLQPRHGERPEKRMWLDADTYLPLRQELWGPDGRLLSATQVVQRPEIVSPKTAQARTMPVNEEMGSVQVVRGDQDWLMAEDDLRHSLGHPLGRVTAMPEGFMLVGAYLHMCPDALGPCARWELTDGVATVNVIQTSVDVNEIDGLETPQDVHGPIQTEQRGKYHFIVRGNLPAEELRRIANSIVLE